MTEPHSGDMAQIRLMGDAIADAAIVRFQSSHPPHVAKVEVPAPLKWAGGIVAAMLSLAASAGMIWLVTTVNSMQVTLARMDERMVSGSVKDGRVDEMDRRVTKLESTIYGGEKP